MEIVYISLGIIVAGIIFFFKTPIGKGMIGEFLVKLMLGKTKQGKKYVIHNLMIVIDGKSSQIDHVYINTNGIFVIETKNYAGYIYGYEEQKEWTQVLSYGRVKNRFYSPILQNRTHIYMLSQLLNRKGIYTSIVIFPRAKLNTETTTHVGYLTNIRKFIKLPSHNTTISVEEMESIYHSLIELKKIPQMKTRDHIKNINQMKVNIEKNICPRCGKNLS